MMKKGIESGGTKLNPEQDFEGKTREALIERINQLQEENERLQELATKDPLTALYNRRGFEEAIGYIVPSAKREDERRSAKRNGNPVAFLLLDIDNFKTINDTYGHDAGDEVLKQTADFLKSKGISRKSDIVGRWGGEEFAVAFQDIDAKKVIEKFYKKDQKKAQINFQAVINGKEILVTLSGGVTELNPGENLEDTAKRADKGLYRAKRTGKNIIEWVRKE